MRILGSAGFTMTDRRALRGRLCVAVVWLTCLWAAAPVCAQTPPKPAEMRWGGDPEGGYPYVEADPNDPTRVEGFDVDVAALIAKGLGLRPRFVSVQFASIDASVRRGDFLIGLSGIEDTPARRASMAVTVPYYLFREVLTIRASDRERFRSLADLRTRRVGTLGGTIAYEILLKSQAEGGVVAVSYDDDVHPYSDLLLGRLDAVLLDHVLADKAMRRQKGLTTLPEAVAVSHYVGVLAPSNAALRDRVDVLLRAGMRDGSLEAIFRRWGIWNDDQPALYARVLAASAPGGGAAPAQGAGSSGAATIPGAAPKQGGAAAGGAGQGDAAPADGAAPATNQPPPLDTGVGAVIRYLPALAKAALITIVLSCLSMALAVVVGVLVASGRV
jgi:polar amino acid transport system substrate-binding protein